jgi:hypothetical protein
MKRPFFPTVLSIPFYIMRRYVGLRTYQHPLVLVKEFLSGRSQTFGIDGQPF